MLSALLKMSGLLTLKIVYGKAYSQKATEKTWLTLLLSIANIFWLISILLLIPGGATGDTILMAVGYPVAITIWTIISRKQINDEQSSPNEIKSEADNGNDSPDC